MATTLRIKRRAAGTAGAPTGLASAELAFNETSLGRILYYGLGNDGYGAATSVIPIGGPDFINTTNANLTGVILSSGNVTSINSQTGTGSKFVVDTSPVLITPNIGTPSAGTLTSCTGLPVTTGISGLASGAATFLTTPTSANLALLLTDETGSGPNVFATSPTLTTPVLGVATATSINKVTITQPAAGSTLTISDGCTLTVPANGSISGTNTGDNAVNTLYSGLVSNATHTGDATGNVALTVVRINGVSLAGLSTGLLKNTTTTGQPSIAIADTDYVAPGGALGTPSSGNLTNCTFPTLNQNTTGSSGSCTGNSSTVTTNANLTGVITSIGNATSIASQTGTGTKFVVDTSPTLITPNIGVATGTSLTLSGNLTVNGTTTTLNSTTLDISDKNIVLGNVASPTEITCDGGGITLKGATDHTFNYVATGTSWTSSENLNLASGKVLKINGTTVISATAVIGLDIDGGSF